MLPLTDALQGPGKSLLWSKPMEQALYAAKSALAAAAELEHPQADLPHQPHGRHIQHSYQCCPSTFSSSIMGSPFLPRSCCPLRLATAPSTGVAGRLRRDLPLPPHVGGQGILCSHQPQASLSRLGRLSAPWSAVPPHSGTLCRTGGLLYHSGFRGGSLWHANLTPWSVLV